jgi:hypothetical protein
LEREQLIDEFLMLLPTLIQAIGGPDPSEIAEFASRGAPVDVRVSPGHVRILTSLSRRPHFVARLTEAFARRADEEALVFVKGLKSLTEGFGVAPGEES